MSRKPGVIRARLEELENTNNIRFLRRRYKDPVTGKDFKLLHVGEVQLTGSPGIAGASPIGGPAAQAGGAALLGAASTMLGGAATQTAPGAGTPAATLAPNAAGDSGADATSANPDSPDASKSDSSPAGGIGSAQLSSAVFGGGPIVGVASISKATTIREFNHKNHYNQWQFIYDPTMDRGGLITTPAQPALQSAAPAAAAEFIQPQLARNRRALLAECRVRRRRSPTSSNSNKSEDDGDGFDGRGRPSSISLGYATRAVFASMIRSISITPIHWPVAGLGVHHVSAQHLGRGRGRQIAMVVEKSRFHSCHSCQCSQQRMGRLVLGGEYQRDFKLGAGVIRNGHRPPT